MTGHTPQAVATVCGLTFNLYGTPRAYLHSETGAATVIFGELSDGTALAIAAGNLQWFEQAEVAVRQAWAGGKVRGGMTAAVTP